MIKIWQGDSSKIQARKGKEVEKVVEIQVVEKLDKCKRPTGEMETTMPEQPLIRKKGIKVTKEPIHPLFAGSRLDGRCPSPEVQEGENLTLVVEHKIVFRALTSNLASTIKPLTCSKWMLDPWIKRISLT